MPSMICQYCGRETEISNRVCYGGPYWHERCLYEHLKKTMPDSPALKHLARNLEVVE